MLNYSTDSTLVESAELHDEVLFHRALSEIPTNFDSDVYISDITDGIMIDLALPIFSELANRASESSWCVDARFIVANWQSLNKDHLLDVCSGISLYLVGKYWNEIEYMELAASMGQFLAMHAFAKHLYSVKMEKRAGEEMYQLAAESGNSYSMVELAYIMRQSDRRKESRKWFEKAADQQNCEALFALSSDHSLNLPLKYRYVAQAAKLGHWGAIRLFKNSIAQILDDRDPQTLYVSGQLVEVQNRRVFGEESGRMFVSGANDLKRHFRLISHRCNRAIIYWLLFSKHILCFPKDMRLSIANLIFETPWDFFKCTD